MKPEQLALARRRPWPGITNVGFRVLMAAMGLYCLLNCGTSGMGILLLGSIFVPVLATQAVFDFVGGTESMPGPRPSLTTFLGGWLRGVFGHRGDFAGQFKPLPASEQASLKAHDSEWCGPVP